MQTLRSSSRRPPVWPMGDMMLHTPKASQRHSSRMNQTTMSRKEQAGRPWWVLVVESPFLGTRASSSLLNSSARVETSHSGSWDLLLGIFHFTDGPSVEWTGQLIV